MKPLTREWVEKAEGDWATASREMRARKAPNWDAVCFHAQQCVEKYLKAMLQEADVAFGKTHHLVTLLDLALAIDPTIEPLRTDLLQLTAFAVQVRYPGASADRDAARQAWELARALRTRLRTALGAD